MRRLRFVLALLLSASVTLHAETAAEKRDRLQRSIDGASELGNFPRVQELRMELAEHSKGMGDFGASARQYELLLAARPKKRDRVRLYVELGRMRGALQNYSGAISAFQDALHDDPKFWDGNLELARAYAKAELSSKAIEAFQKCMKLRPEAHEPYEEIASVYQHLGYLNKAITNYQKALHREKKPEIFLELADTYVRQENMDKATQVLQEARARVPRPDYDVRLGDIFRKRGDLAKAAGAWEEALKLDPHRDDVRLKLVMVYDRLHRRSETDRLLRDLTAQYPQSPLVHFLRAWILLDRGDRRAARSEAMTVRRLAPTELVQHYNERLLSLLQ